MTDEDFTKKIKSLEKQIAIQKNLINKFILTDKDKIKNYIDENLVVNIIISALEFNNFKVHRQAFKNFLTSEKYMNLDLLNTDELEIALTSNKYTLITMKTLNQRLEELKTLGLLEFDNKNNYIIGTDLLATMIKGKYTRVNKSIPNGLVFKYKTEDKLLLYRLYDKEYRKTLSKEDLIQIEKFEIYKNVYVASENRFIIGRIEKESEDKVYKRLVYVLTSKFNNRESKYNGEILEYKDTILYIHKSIKITEKDLQKYLLKPREYKPIPFIPNFIKIERYET